MKTDTTMAPTKLRPCELASDSLPMTAPEYFERKRIGARLFGCVLLAAMSPVMILLCLLVKLTSRGPTLFRQVRVGKGGRHFNILKLRTMYEDAEHTTGPTWCSPGDSRITPLGKWLRFLHLDELPQLINVVRGEMALVGPRPERPEIIASENLAELVPNYHDRHLILPGVTGLAQINLPADQTIDCVHRKIALDVEYINTANLALDLRILTCTALRMLGIRHGIAVRFLRLDRPEGRSASRNGVRVRTELAGWARDRTCTLGVGSSLSANGAASPTCSAAPIAEFEVDVVAAIAHKHPR